MKKVFFSMAMGSFFAACSERQPDPITATATPAEPTESIRIVERKDTVVTLDPSTGKESIQVITAYDTIVEMK